MFEDSNFETYSLKQLPLKQDCFMMDECYLSEFHHSWLDIISGGPGENVGSASCIGVQCATSESAQICWYVDIGERWHEVIFTLPQVAFVTCVEISDFGGKPTIFVKSEWLNQLLCKNLVAYAMIDAIGTKNLIREGQLSREVLQELRMAMDKLSSEYADIVFISAADAVIVKAGWKAGNVRADVKYTYDPECLLEVAEKVMVLYKAVLGLDAYAIFTQGYDFFQEEQLISISESGNHICVNSIGFPFAQLHDVESDARKNVKTGKHKPHELYLDERFFLSLKFKPKFERRELNRYDYTSLMTQSRNKYVCMEFAEIRSNLRKRG